MTDIVIASARRTAIGAFQGQFDGVPATQLGSAAIGAALSDAGIEGKDVSEVLMGCVLPAGLKQAPARQAAVGAGIPYATACTTVNKVCGSGMKAMMIGVDAIKARSARVVVAGGMESMTNAPYLLPKARGGYRMGHGQTFDHMFMDGLENAYDGKSMGTFGELCADKYAFSRASQDAFAISTVERAMAAMQNGSFDNEIVPVTVKTRKGEVVVRTDEEPPRCKIDKIPNLRAAFAQDGTVTAATSSSISDGAAATVLLTATNAERQGIEPLARVAGHATFAQEPEWFTTAPVGAINRLYERLGWNSESVDLFEINEAFAVVPMAAIHELHIDPAKVNVNGGACALGHPIGASGCRIVVTLIHALRARGLKRGVASLCIGGGEATAIGIEIP
jgi:acetyl-CoA C-acetyltransferase